MLLRSVGLRRGGLAPPPTPPDQPKVVMLSAGPLAAESSGNTLQVGLPPGADSGDAILAFVMHRYDLTIPEGWQELLSQVTPPENPAYDQKMTVLQRNLSAPDEGVLTLTQAGSNRFVAQAIAVRGDSGSVHVADMDSGQYQAYPLSPGLHASPTLGARNGDLVVAASTCVSGLTRTSTYAPMDDGWEAVTPVATTDHRLAVAARQVVDNGLYSVIFEHSISNHDGAEVLLVIRDGQPDP